MRDPAPRTHRRGAPGLASRALVATLATTLGAGCVLSAGCVLRAGPARAADDPFGPVPPPGVRPVPPAAGPGAGDPGAGPEPDAPADVTAYRGWLRRDDWLCRALAARELRLRSDDGVVGALAAALDREQDARVLAILLGSLVGRPREDLLVEGGGALAERLVALLDAREASVRERALSTLVALPPVRLPRDPALLRSWFARGRDGLRVEADLLRKRREARRATATGGLPSVTKTVAPLAMRRYGDLERIEREGLEVVVCLDQTGSMEPVIEAAKASIVRLVRRMRELAPRLRVGLVTYDDVAYVRMPLTTDELALERELRRVHAGGGGDYEEGVDKAIAVALEQRKVAWSRKAMRVIVVVGDAPPHADDVRPLLTRIAKARTDPAFESPVRVDTISTAGDPDLVPHFAAIASVGKGAALRLGTDRDLAAELLLASFGPAWRKALEGLLAELESLDAGKPPRRR